MLGNNNYSEKAMAPHSSTLAWKSPWMEEPGGLQSMGSLRVGHDWAASLSLLTFMHWGRKWQPTPVFLPGESQGQGSLVGCRLCGHTESDTTERLHFHALEKEIATHSSVLAYHYFPSILPSHSLLVSSATRTKYCRLGGLNNRHLLLTVLEAGSLRSWCQQGRFHSEAFSLILSAGGLVCFPMTSLRAHWVKRESDWSLIFLLIKTVLWEHHPYDLI